MVTGGANMSPAGITADVTHVPAPTLFLARARACTPLLALASVMDIAVDVRPVVKLPLNPTLSYRH